MAQYQVALRADYRWSTARVAGRLFSKTPTLLAAHELTDEIKNAALLVVNELAPDEPSGESLTIELVPQPGIEPMMPGANETISGGFAASEPPVVSEVEPPVVSEVEPAQARRRVRGAK